jgi:hypothetical protein
MPALKASEGFQRAVGRQTGERFGRLGPYSDSRLTDTKKAPRLVSSSASAVRSNALPGFSETSNLTAVAPAGTVFSHAASPMRNVA